MYSDYSGQIMKMFQMNRRPTSKQEEYILEWQKNNYSFELINYAYEITVEKINQLNFKYINTILESWAKSGYTTIQEIKENNYYKIGKKTNNNSVISTDPDIEKYKVLINKF